MFFLKEIKDLRKQVKELSVLAKFPHANPNIVFNMDDKVNVQYINPAAEQWLKMNHFASYEQILQLIPQNSLDILNSTDFSQDNIIEGESYFQHHFYTYKISKFKGAGFEAEMNMVHTMLENQTEPTIEQKEEAKAQQNLTHDENCILVCLLKQGYTWRYANTISGETGISKTETTDYLQELMVKGYAKNGNGSNGEIWSITALGKSVQEQYQQKNILP